jgi:hypothetical protein
MDLRLMAGLAHRFEAVPHGRKRAFVLAGAASAHHLTGQPEWSAIGYAARIGTRHRRGRPVHRTVDQQVLDQEAPAAVL